MTDISNSMPGLVRSPGSAGAPTKPAVVVRDRQELAVPGKTVFEEPRGRAGLGAADEAAAAAAVERLNEYVQHERRTLSFSVDQASGRVVITITDAETDKVIRQIPAEEVLALMRNFQEGLGPRAQRGLLVSETA